MNKAEVCAALGVSDRTVQRLTSQGRLPCRYENAPNGGRRPVYETADVEKLKKQMAAGSSGETTGQSMAVAGRLPVQQFKEMIEGLVVAIARANPAPPAIAITDKFTLTLAEAAELSGLARGFLREAIRSRKLKGIRGAGRGFRIKRSDLETFVRGLV